MIAEPPLLSISLLISTLRSTRQAGQLNVRCHSANAWRGGASAVDLVGVRLVTAAAATTDLPSRAGLFFQAGDHGFIGQTFFSCVAYSVVGI
jgi:hypothetical protein